MEGFLLRCRDASLSGREAVELVGWRWATQHLHLGSTNCDNEAFLTPYCPLSYGLENGIGLANRVRGKEN